VQYAEKKIEKLLLEVIDIDPNISLDVDSWGNGNGPLDINSDPNIPLNADSWDKVSNPNPNEVGMWNSRLRPAENGIQYDESLPLYRDYEANDYVNQQGKVFRPPLDGTVNQEITDLYKQWNSQDDANNFIQSKKDIQNMNDFIDKINKINNPKSNNTFLKLGMTGLGAGTLGAGALAYANRQKKK